MATATIIPFPNPNAFGLMIHVEVQLSVGLRPLIKTMVCFGPFETEEACRKWYEELWNIRRKNAEETAQWCAETSERLIRDGWSEEDARVSAITDGIDLKMMDIDELPSGRLSLITPASWRLNNRLALSLAELFSCPPCYNFMKHTKTKKRQ